MKKRFFYIISFLLSVCLFSCLVSSVWAETKMDTPSAGIIPKLPKTPNDPELFNGHVYPEWGPVCQRYTYSVVYQDKENRPPEYMKIYFNGQMIDMEKADPKNSDYKKGVKYIYQYAPDKLGGNFYYFEASNGLGKTRDSIIDSPDNGPVLFESAFDQNEVVLIDPLSGEIVWRYSTDKEWVGGVALSDDGRYLAVLTTHHVYFFSTDSNEPDWEYEFNLSSPIGGGPRGNGIAISGDGSRVIAATGMETALFDKEKGEPIWKHAAPALAVAISNNGQYAAASALKQGAGDLNNAIFFWRTDKADPLWDFTSSGNFHDVTLSADGEYLAASTGCPDRQGYIFSKEGNQPLVKTGRLTFDSPVSKSKITADGSLAAFATEGGPDSSVVILFSKDSQEPLWKFDNQKKNSSRALGITPDGQFMAAATMQGDIYLLGKEGNVPVKSWSLHTSVGGLDIANDGSFIALGGTDSLVQILFVDGGEKKIAVNEFIQTVDVAGNNKYVAVGTGGSVYFFEDYLSSAKNRVFECSAVIEPPPIEMTMGGGMEPLSQADKKMDRETKWPGMIFGFGFLVSALALAGYLARVKFNLFNKNKGEPLKVNKKVVILLSGLAGLFLALTIIFVLMINGENGQNFNQPQGGREKEICGNGLCEGEMGETQKSCPQDCSMGD